MKSINSRFRKHITETKNGFGCKYLAKAILKYGEEAFSIELIAEANSKEELDKLEIYYISKYNSNDNSIGYNLTDGGDGGNTYKYLSKEELDEIFKKISESKVGIKNPNHKSVKCLNVDTGEELFFDTVKECQEYFGEANHNFITRRCTGSTKCLYNKIWNIAYQDSEYQELTKTKNTSRKSQIKVFEKSHGFKVRYISNTFAKKQVNGSAIIKGYHIIKINKGVSTIPDECKGVGAETGAASKLETTNNLVEDIVSTVGNNR